MMAVPYFKLSLLGSFQLSQTFAYQDAMQAVDAMRDAFSQIQLAPDFDPATAEPILFEQLIWWLSYSWVLGKSEAAEQVVL